MYAKLCSDLEQASHNLAIAFVQKMYDVKKSDMDEIYFISNDPTGTLGYGDHFWDIGNMYETLLHNYEKDDVWNWYWYSLGHSGENRETYINLCHFVSKYSGYTGDLDDIEKQEREAREANTRYWNSHDGKVEIENRLNEIKDEYLKNIKNEKMQ